MPPPLHGADLVQWPSTFFIPVSCHDPTTEASQLHWGPNSKVGNTVLEQTVELNRMHNALYGDDQLQSCIPRYGVSGLKTYAPYIQGRSTYPADADTHLHCNVHLSLSDGYTRDHFLPYEPAGVRSSLEDLLSLLTYKHECDTVFHWWLSDCKVPFWCQD